MKFSIIISSWNSRKLLDQNLPKALLCGADEVIIADDSSTDGSVEFLKKNFPEVEVVSHTRLGFAGNCNRGVELASGDIVVLLNTDVVPDKNLLKPLVKDFSDPSVFAVSFNERNDQRFSWTKGHFKNGFIVHESGEKGNKVHNTFWASGGSAAFRRSYWEKLGGMDEAYNPFYWEDIDLSYRAQRRGWKILWDPRAVVAHGHKGVIRDNFSPRYVGLIQERNHLIFVWKNLLDSNLLKQHLADLVRRLVRRPGYVKVVLSALVRLPAILPLRAVERRELVKSDRDILFAK